MNRVLAFSFDLSEQILFKWLDLKMLNSLDTSLTISSREYFLSQLQKVSFSAVKVQDCRRTYRSASKCEVVGYNAFRYLILRGVRFQHVSIDFVNCPNNFTDVFMSINSHPFPNKLLTSFHIENCGLFIDEDCTNDFESLDETLVAKHDLNSVVKYITRNCTTLTTINLPEYSTKQAISEDCMLSVLQSSQHLTEFFVNSFCKRITNVTLECLSQHCPQLKLLDLSGHTKSPWRLTDAGFESFFKACTQLQTLKFYKYNIESEAFVLRQLNRAVVASRWVRNSN
jgi:hypothetical protein